MDADGHVHKFDIYQSAVAPNCFKSHTDPWCPNFFNIKKVVLSGVLSGIKKEVLSGVLSGIDLVQHNIAYTEQFVLAWKKYIYLGLSASMIMT